MRQMNGWEYTSIGVETLKQRPSASGERERVEASASAVAIVKETNDLGSICCGPSNDAFLFHLVSNARIH